MSGLRSDIPTEHKYKLSGASLPKTRIYISDTARLQRVITDLLHQYRMRPHKRAQRCSVYYSIYDSTDKRGSLPLVNYIYIIITSIYNYN